VSPAVDAVVDVAEVEEALTPEELAEVEEDVALEVVAVEPAVTYCIWQFSFAHVAPIGQHALPHVCSATVGSA
jgi:hypothetical protein